MTRSEQTQGFHWVLEPGAWPAWPAAPAVPAPTVTDWLLLGVRSAQVSPGSTDAVTTKLEPRVQKVRSYRRSALVLDTGDAVTRIRGLGQDTNIKVRALILCCVRWSQQYDMIFTIKATVCPPTLFWSSFCKVKIKLHIIQIFRFSI